MKILLLLLFLSVPTLAQTAVEPVRVSITIEAREPHGDEFDRLVRAELRKNRNIVIASRKIDYEVYVVATPLTENGKFFGYAGALLVVTQSKSSERYKLSIHTSRSLDALARHLVEKLDREFFKSKG